MHRHEVFLIECDLSEHKVINDLAMLANAAMTPWVPAKPLRFMVFIALTVLGPAFLLCHLFSGRTRTFENGPLLDVRFSSSS